MKKIILILLVAGLGIGIKAESINSERSKVQFKIKAIGFKSVEGEILLNGRAC